MLLPEAQAALSALHGVVAGVRDLGQLTNTLRSKPDGAAAKLSEALEEIRKTCEAVDQALVKFLLLAESPTYAQLLELQGGTMLAYVEANRGHCSTMTRIFERYVKNWFNTTLAPAQTNMANAVFMRFASADADIFGRLSECVAALQREATALTRSYLDHGPDSVKTRARAVAPEVLDLRRVLGETLVTVVREQWAFRDISGAFQAG
jgi:hypothetical protein